MIGRIYIKLIAFFQKKLANRDRFVRQLRKLPRYKEGSIALQGRAFRFADSASLIFTYEEIFKKNIYEFSSDTDAPYIIDAGANIGLSVLYFKKLFPKATVLAFEPDKKIAGILQDNIDSHNLQNVSVINKGLWDEEKEMTFYAEGADAGRISSEASATSTIQVTLLGPYLTRPVDLLKMDIEGAETTVLRASKDKLRLVKRIFVEYHSFVGQEQTLSELLSILTEAGFRLNINVPGLVSKKPLVKVNVYNGMDMQLNIYGYRP